LSIPLESVWKVKAQLTWLTINNPTLLSLLDDSFG